MLGFNEEVLNEFGYPPRTIDADIFDTVEFAALANGGIGRSIWFELQGENGDPNKPVCINGLIVFAGIYEKLTGDVDPLAMPNGSNIGLISTNDNDSAVFGLNEIKGTDSNEKVSFEEFVHYLNIHRGE